MLRRHQCQVPSASVVAALRRLTPAGAIALAAVLTGCATDISRLERPGFVSGPVPPETIGRRNAGGPPAFDNSGWSDSGQRTPAPASQIRGDRVASLPDSSIAEGRSNPSVPFDAPRRPKTVVAAPQPGQRAGAVPVLGGETIEVQPGDSLFSLHRRYKVSIAALMDLNGLKNANLKPGQKIRLPDKARRPIAKAPIVKTLEPAAASTASGQPAAPARHPAPVMAEAAPPVAAAPPADVEGSYTVKPGDSLYGIARAHKMTAAQLQQANGITDPLKIKPGTTLKVVGGAAHVADAAGPGPAIEPKSTAANGGIRVLNAAPKPPAASTKVAALGPVSLPAPGGITPVSSPGAVAAAGKFLWPAKGTILAGFGKRPDGINNDGINIAVPAGTGIAAAESGTVAYAGSEIKVYGNLVLLRHEGGWVTAYAHADQLLVKRGDEVKRGQIIAKAGATGSVDQPQVHFELRQGSKPVDPMPHMEK